MKIVRLDPIEKRIGLSVKAASAIGSDSPLAANAFDIKTYSDPRRTRVSMGEVFGDFAKDFKEGSGKREDRRLRKGARRREEAEETYDYRQDAEEYLEERRRGRSTGGAKKLDVESELRALGAFGAEPKEDVAEEVAAEEPAGEDDATEDPASQESPTASEMTTSNQESESSDSVAESPAEPAAERAAEPTAERTTEPAADPAADPSGEAPTAEPEAGDTE